MENQTSRILIETVVKKALRDIEDSPERSIRNIVDMALHFSSGRFQQEFFAAAQTMLQNENSPYYDLLEDVIRHTDNERILHFGMNLGYNGCKIGAERIRQIEQQEQYNIPWSVSLAIDPKQYDAYQNRYQEIVRQGETLGIYVWMLFCPKDPKRVLTLVREHPDSAFLLFCEPREMTVAFLDDVSELSNLMLVVHYDDAVGGICDVLHQMGLLYSVYSTYSDENYLSVLNGDLFCNTEQLHTLFTVLISEPSCSRTVREQVYTYAVNARNDQLFRTLPWELAYDGSFLDSIISNDACSAGFGEDGSLCALYDTCKESSCNLFQNDLVPILRFAFPKKECGQNG